MRICKPVGFLKWHPFTTPPGGFRMPYKQSYSRMLRLQSGTQVKFVSLEMDELETTKG